MIEIVRYTPGKASEWDAFVRKSKNATFLFYRGYMDYHADRFEDFSLMLGCVPFCLLMMMATARSVRIADLLMEGSLWTPVVRLLRCVRWFLP